jgi:hypothetical protein
MKRFVEGEDCQQATLLPACLDDYVTEDNPVRVIDVFIDELDLEALGFAGVVPEEHFPDLPASDENERLFASLKAAWDKASQAVRKRFVTEVLGGDIEV